MVKSRCPKPRCDFVGTESQIRHHRISGECPGEVAEAIERQSRYDRMRWNKDIKDAKRLGLPRPVRAQPANEAVSPPVNVPIAPPPSTTNSPTTAAAATSSAASSSSSAAASTTTTGSSD